MKKTLFQFIATAGLLLASVVAVLAQPINFNTFAGYAGQGHSDGSGSNARFNHPHGLAIDGAGNIYIADTDNHTIRKMTSAGIVSTVAGLAGVSGSTDDIGSNARFFRPQGIAVDGNDLYVADSGNHTIRKISPGGIVNTFAGLAGVSGNDNGVGTGARFNQPLGIALDQSHNIYVSDFGNGAIRVITPDAGVATLAAVAGPQGISVDNNGNIFVADFSSSIISKSSGGIFNTIAGAANTYGSLDANGTNALFYNPAAVALDGGGNIFVADYFNHTIRKITPGGTVSTLAGLAGNPGSVDGANNSARFRGPEGIVVDNTGNIFVADTGNSTIRKISALGTNWIVSTIAGSPSSASVDADFSHARFNSPIGIAADGAGNIFVADSQNSTVRKISPNGNATTFAGFAGISGSVDGAGDNARFSGPQSVAIDNNGNIFVADSGNHTIRKITLGGSVSTFAGTAGNFGNVDGTGAAAEFYQPQGIAVDGAGNIFVADTMNHTIRKITSSGIVSTLAGSAQSFGGTDGTNANARFNWPTGIAVDNAGKIYVADYFNHTIRKITASGTNWITSTIAGLAGVWGNADGTNSSARFSKPQGVAADGFGNIYVVDSGNHTIHKLAPDGTNWVTSTLAGFPGTSGSADGAGSVARFFNPAGIAVDSAGYLYVADFGNNTIRVNRIVPPPLQIWRVANQLIFSWPLSAPGFSLEASSIFSPGGWAGVPGTPTISGDTYVLTNNLGAGMSFFRLHKP